jgi:hypothetical protein
MLLNPTKAVNNVEHMQYSLFHLIFFFILVAGFRIFTEVASACLSLSKKFLVIPGNLLTNRKRGISLSF